MSLCLLSLFDKSNSIPFSLLVSLYLIALVLFPLRSTGSLEADLVVLLARFLLCSLMTVKYLAIRFLTSLMIRLISYSDSAEFLSITCWNLDCSQLNEFSLQLIQLWKEVCWLLFSELSNFELLRHFLKKDLIF